MNCMGALRHRREAGGKKHRPMVPSALLDRWACVVHNRMEAVPNRWPTEEALGDERNGRKEHECAASRRVSIVHYRRGPAV